MSRPTHRQPLVVVALLAIAALLCGFGGAADWAPVEIGGELDGWTLTEVEPHNEFRRFRFEQEGQSTTVEVVRLADGAGLNAQAAPGAQPPESLVAAVSRTLDSAPESLIMPQNPRHSRTAGDDADPLESARAAPLAWLHCLPDSEVEDVLTSGATSDWTRVSSASRRLSAMVAGTTLIVGLLGLWRRRSGWLGEPLQDAPDTAENRRDLMMAAGLAFAAIALYLPFILAAAGSPPWGGPDTEIYSSLFWNASHGRGLYNAYESMDHSGSHSSLGLYLLVPFYALAPGPKAILVINTALLVGCVAPVFLIARSKLSRPYSAGLALLFLGFPALDGLLMSMHAVKAATPALLWGLYFLVRRRPTAFLFAICVAALFKENVSIVLVGLGAYLAFERETRWAAAFVFSLGVTTYVVGTRVVIPAHFGDFGGATLGHYSHFGGGLGSVALSPIAQPGTLFAQLTDSLSLTYLAASLLPLALIPALAPRHALIALPVLAQNVLSSSVHMRSSTNHYDSLLLPGLFFAAAYGLARIPEGKKRLVAMLVAVVATGALDTVVGAPDPWRWDREDASTVGELEELVALVPDGASVSAANQIGSWFYRRPLLTREQAGAGIEVEAEYRVVWEAEHQHQDHLEPIGSAGDFLLLRDTRTLEDRCRSMMTRESGE